MKFCISRLIKSEENGIWGTTLEGVEVCWARFSTNLCDGKKTESIATLFCPWDPVNPGYRTELNCFFLKDTLRIRQRWGEANQPLNTLPSANNQASSGLTLALRTVYQPLCVTKRPGLGTASQWSEGERAKREEKKDNTWQDVYSI